MQRQQFEEQLVPGTDYSLPRRHHVEQSIDWSCVFRPSAQQPLPSSNKGYQLLQKMGWTGSGLGRCQDGA